MQKKVEAKSGDVVKLAKGKGILVDYETGFEIVNDQEVTLGKVIGERTREALISGGLLIISDKTLTSSSKGKKSDLPEDIPERETLIKLGLTFAKVKALKREQIQEIGLSEQFFDDLVTWASKNTFK